jgi:hypothetical protein
LRLGSLKAVFEKIQRYQNRRISLSIPEFTSKTVYTLTDTQVLVLDTQGLTPEEFFLSHKGNRDAVIFESVVTQDEPMTLEEICDLAEDLVKTIWDCKDRIKKLADQKGIGKAVFWDEIKSNIELCIVADLANTIKHDGLSKPPLSGIKPVIDGVRNYAKGNGSAVYSRKGKDITVYRSLTDYEIFASIRNLEDQQRELGEVFSFCELAVTQWQSVIDNLGIKIPERLLLQGHNN